MRSLESFEAVSRYGNVTRAAEELGRTQGAISRSISSLEEFVGKELFVRDKRKLVLKDSVRTYLDKITHALDTLERETSRFSNVTSEEHVLRLGVLPTLASRWLMPRLAEYISNSVSTELHLVKGLGRTDFERLQVDAAIECGYEEPAGLVAHRLMDEKVVAVISPDLYRDTETISYNKLFMPARSEAWEVWGGERDRPATDKCTMFENYTMMIEAACLGLGVAVLPTIYVEQDLESGRLVTPFGAAVSSGRAYWLTYPHGASNKPKLKEFVDWLIDNTD